MSPEFENAPNPSMLSVRPMEPQGDGAEALGIAGLGTIGAITRDGEIPPDWPPSGIPVFEGTLEELLRSGSTLDCLALDDCMDAIQERSLDSLYALLDAAGVSREERLVLCLDVNGVLDVEEHPQRAVIVAALAAHPEVTARMRTMAALALTERGMGDIALAGRMMRGHSPAENSSGERLFQACLKGGLSHFHLVRRN